MAAQFSVSGPNTNLIKLIKFRAYKQPRGGTATRIRAGDREREGGTIIVNRVES